MRVFGGVKGKRKRHPASRGSLDPVIFLFIVHSFFFLFFFALFIFLHKLKANNSCTAAGRRCCSLSTVHQGKKNVVFIPEPDF